VKSSRERGSEREPGNDTRRSDSRESLFMNLSDDALRWMAYQANRCDALDCAEALALVAPAVAGYLHLPPMSDREAKAFGDALTAALANDLKREAA